MLCFYKTFDYQSGCSAYNSKKVMKSKASFNSHPFHPMLIAFPIAFLTGTLLFDLLCFLDENSNFYQTARYLNVAGIIAGLVAAVPGFIDYMYTIPPESSAKKRGTKHALVNVSAITLFTVALLLRKADALTPGLEVLLPEIGGMVFLAFGGYMGGTLVYRNQIGVDPRYAEAGKWKEEYLEPGKDQYDLGLAGSLKTDQMMLLHMDGKRVVLAKTEKGFVAFDDHCTHKGGSLAGGTLVCGTVQCPWHGSQFDVFTGKVKAGPAREDINTYKVEVKEGRIVLMPKAVS